MCGEGCWHGDGETGQVGGCGVSVMDTHSGWRFGLYIIWLWPEECLRGWDGVTYAPLPPLRLGWPSLVLQLFFLAGDMGFVFGYLYSIFNPLV